jgi:hypothetical protein
MCIDSRGYINIKYGNIYTILEEEETTYRIRRDTNLKGVPSNGWYFKDLFKSICINLPKDTI